MAASKTLGEAIVVPQVFGALTSRYVLVTEWIEGVKVGAFIERRVQRCSFPGGVWCCFTRVVLFFLDHKQASVAVQGSSEYIGSGAMMLVIGGLSIAY